MISKGIAFLSGISSLLIITSVENAIFTFALGFLFFVLIYIVFNANKSAKIQSLKIFLLGLIWASLNIYFWSNHSSQAISSPINADVDGYICSIPERKNNRFQFDFCIEQINNKRIQYAQFDRFKFSWGRYAPQPLEPLKSGQYWRFKAKLKPPHGRYNHGSFDYQKWMLAQGYAGVGQVKRDPANKLPELLTKTSFRSGYHRVRQNVYEKLMSLLPDNQFRGMLIALGMGERGGINQQQWDVLRQSGTSHLLAISGLHVGVAALWSYWLVLLVWRLSERLCLFVPAQKVAEAGSLLGGLSILLLSGMGLPAQRAFLMLLVFIISRWRGLHYGLTSVLGIALILILLWHPFAVLSASFWLSFIAVFIIALVLNRQVMQPNKKFNSKLIVWLKINGFLFLTMLPLSIIFFDMFSIVSILANLILIPIASFLLIPVLYFAMLLTLFSETAAVWLYYFASMLIEFVFWIQFNLASINQDFSGIKLSEVSVLLLVLLVCLVLLPRNIYSKVNYLPVLLIFLLVLPLSEKTKYFEMTVFDIGQGLSVYIETPEGELLFDTGWGNKEYALANSTIIPFLESRNRQTIDKVIISHGDSDHAGGLDKLSEYLQIKELIVGETIKGKRSKSCHGYPGWVWSNIKFEFLAHLPPTRLVGNNASCVLSIRTAQGSILLTGDIEKSAEMALVKNGLKQHDILVAPHHGSKTSSNKNFVARLAPLEVIFSTGYNNQWQFPKTEVVDRYKLQSSRVWVTHVNGAIIIALNSEDGLLSVTSLKQSNPHFWH